MESISDPGSYAVLKSISIANFSSLSCKKPLSSPRFWSKLSKKVEGILGLRQIAVVYSFFMGHLACHSSSILNHVPDTVEGEQNVLHFQALQMCIFLIAGWRAISAFSLFLGLCRHAAQFTHLYHMLCSTTHLGLCLLPCSLPVSIAEQANP